MANYTNGSAQLICQASGIPVPVITWFRNNTVITNEFDRIDIQETEDITQNERNITSVLTITNLELSDTAFYHCVTSNPGALGSLVTFTDVSDTAFLRVERKYCCPFSQVNYI